MLSDIFTINSIVGLTLLGILVKLVFNKFGSGLNHIPGPALAGYSDIWRLCLVAQWRPERTHIALHKKLGAFVRLGPRNVSIDNPDAIKIIYAPGGGFVKSEFYPVQQTITRDGHYLQGMFNTTDEAYHTKLRRAVSNAFAMSTLVNFEPLVDSTTQAFLFQLSRRFADNAGNEGVCDLSSWLQYYAFDVIGELAFSKRLGFVDEGRDVDNIITNLEGFLEYSAVIGQMPILDRLLLKNPMRRLLAKVGLVDLATPVVAFAQRRMADRLAVTEGTQDSETHGTTRRDFLSRFLEAGQKDPVFINKQRVLSLTVATVFAGSDTTAISLRSIFYNLLSNPNTLQKLLDELDDCQRQGKFSHPVLVRWAEVHELPYLSAVIKEALRCHPAAGLPLERVVPAQGAQICGMFFPAGTVVGCSAWTIHRNTRVFGEDAEDFRPERWIDGTEKELTDRNNCLFSFGAGARTCVGKHISFLEMYKLIPAILRSFELTLENPDAPLTLHNAWFVKQSGLRVRLKTRQATL